MSDAAIVRPERPDDHPAVHTVNELAFGQPGEADLVDALRGAGAAILSLVAEMEGRIAGHILFTSVTIEGPSGARTAVGLAPMSVLPWLQRRGIGSLLVRRGLEELRAAGHGAVIVLGHPSYYPRFGFVPASRFGLRWEHECPDEAFMALELRPGALAGGGGIVRYRPEFEGV